MPGPLRTPREALDEAREALDRAVMCVTRVPLVRDAGRDSTRLQVNFPDTRFVPLAGDRDLWLRVIHEFTAEQTEDGWTAHTAGYAYEIAAGDPTHEFIAFHFHPGRGRISTPHAHFKTLRDPFPLARAHIPTGIVPLAAVVHMLIDELDAHPLQQNWKRRLSLLGAP